MVTTEAEPLRQPGFDVIRVLGYFTALIFIANVVTPSGALAQLPIGFYLKDQLKLDQQQTAVFGLLSSVPLYGAFLFGMLRDQWAPFGLRDRGFFLLFAPIAAIAYLFMAFRHETYADFLLGLILVGFAYRLIGPAVAGLTACVSKQRHMTGRLGSLVQLMGILVGASLGSLAGWLKITTGIQKIFFVLAGASLVLFLFGLVKPNAIFGIENSSVREHRDFLGDIRRLFRHRALWPALAITLIWSFGPGQATPLFYHLTNVVKLQPEQYGYYTTIGTLAFIPGLLTYGVLCKWVSPRKLLIVATCLAIPQMIPLNYITTPATAYAASAFVGLVGGMAATSYYDLLLRSCPKGLEGTALELSITGSVLVDRYGNLFGSQLSLKPGGFYECNWITVAAYALILPMIFIVPHHVLAKRDGEF